MHTYTRSCSTATYHLRILLTVQLDHCTVMSESELTAQMEADSGTSSSAIPSDGSSTDSSPSTSLPPSRKKIRACRLIFATFVVVLAASTMVLAACVLYNPDCAKMFHSALHELKSQALQVVIWTKSLFRTDTQGDVNGGVSSTTIQNIQVIVDDNVKPHLMPQDDPLSEMDSKMDQIIDQVKTANGQADANENNFIDTEIYLTSTSISSSFGNFFQFNPTSYLERQSLHRDQVVVTGGIESLPTLSTTLISSLKCQIVHMDVWGAVGGLLLGHTPILCGGLNATDKDDPIPSDKCVHLVMPSTMTLPNLQTARVFAASAVLANETTLWVTGGYTSDQENKPLDSTELIDIERGTNDEGPTLPMPLLFHCLVQLNNDQVLLVGGMNDQKEAEDDTYLFDYPSRTWKGGPPLKHARYGHGCGSFFKETSYGQLEMMVLVASGKNSAEERLPVEQINMIHDTEWSLGPQFPYYVDGSGVGGVMVSQTRGVEFIYSKFWLKLICRLSKGCFWITLSSEQKKEKLGRKFSTAFSLSHFSLSSRC